LNIMRVIPEDNEERTRNVPRPTDLNERRWSVAERACRIISNSRGNTVDIAAGKLRRF
jgi:hypothetical protein